MWNRSSRLVAVLGLCAEQQHSSIDGRVLREQRGTAWALEVVVVFVSFTAMLNKDNCLLVPQANPRDAIYFGAHAENLSAIACYPPDSIVFLS